MVRAMARRMLDADDVTTVALTALETFMCGYTDMEAWGDDQFHLKMVLVARPWDAEARVMLEARHADHPAPPGRRFVLRLVVEDVP